FFKPGEEGASSLGRGHTRVPGRVDQHSWLNECFLRLLCWMRTTRLDNHRAYRQAHSFYKGHIAFVMSRHTHHRASAIAFEDEIGDPNWYAFACQRVQGIRAGKDSGHRVLCASVQAIGCLLVSCDIRELCFGGDLWNERMERSQGHKGHAEDCVRACCIYLHAYIWHSIDLYGEFKAFRATNPVALKHLDAFGPVEPFQMVQEFLSIPGQFQKPLLQPASLDERSAALTVPVDNLFGSQHRLVFGAPVDRSGLAFGQAVFEELQEDPLRPAIVAWVGGVDFVRPIEAVADALQLVLSKALDIARSEYAGVNAALDRKVFTVDAKGVEAYWLENIVCRETNLLPSLNAFLASLYESIRFYA